MTTILEHLQSLSKGDQISLVHAGMIVDGTFEELIDDYVVLVDATSPSIKKKRYSLQIPIESICAWGKKERKEKKKRKQKGE
jgi:hypothetical protein